MTSKFTQKPYISDRWAAVDALGFETFKPAISEILQYAETPITLGIFGTWGSGKTTLLKMLMADIEAKKLPSYKSIWFTAWKFTKQESLWRALILRVIEGLYPKKDNGVRYQPEELTDEKQIAGAKYLDRLEKSIYEVSSWYEDQKWLFNAGELAKQGVQLPVWLIFHLAGLGDAAKELGVNPNLAKLLENKVREHHLNQLEYAEQFADYFEKAVRLILGDDGRLVIFIDDLDRCLPEKAIEVLEAIKLFLDVPNTVFVLSADREVIRRGVENYYQSTFKSTVTVDDMVLNGDVYLQKLIQIPFNIPPLDFKSRKEFISSIINNLPAEFRLDDATLQTFALGVFPNPRQIKRALNVYYLLKFIGEEQELQGMIANSLAWPLLAKTVLIQSQWPELYQLWRRYPTLIQALEEEYSKLPITEDDLLLGNYNPVSDSSVDEGDTLAFDQSGFIGRKKTGGLMSPFIKNRHRYFLLAEMLRFSIQASNERHRTQFSGLARSQVQIYVGLIGSVGSREKDDFLSPSDPFPNLQTEIESGDPVRIRELWSKIDENESDEDGPHHLAFKSRLKAVAQSIKINPVVRSVIADTLGKPLEFERELFVFVPIPSAEQPKYYIGKFPVTNEQYARFIADVDYLKPKYWENYKKFDHNGSEKSTSWSDDGWRWIQKEKNSQEKFKKDGFLAPRFWNTMEFGYIKQMHPVVGINWFEANAYGMWLLDKWKDLDESKNNPEIIPKIIRLPTENEWLMCTGDVSRNDRYPWEISLDLAVEKNKNNDVSTYSNVEEGQIGHTTPVWMYPAGQSPLGVWDMCGNVWEWLSNYSSESQNFLTLKGGSWEDNSAEARVSNKIARQPLFVRNNTGFRLIILVN